MNIIIIKWKLSSLFLSNPVHYYCPKWSLTYNLSAALFVQCWSSSRPNWIFSYGFTPGLLQVWCAWCSSSGSHPGGFLIRCVCCLDWLFISGSDAAAGLLKVHPKYLASMIPAGGSFQLFVSINHKIHLQALLHFLLGISVLSISQFDTSL